MNAAQTQGLLVPLNWSLRVWVMATFAFSMWSTRPHSVADWSSRIDYHGDDQIPLVLAVGFTGVGHERSSSE